MLPQDRQVRGDWQITTQTERSVICLAAVLVLFAGAAAAVVVVTFVDSAMVAQICTVSYRIWDMLSLTTWTESSNSTYLHDPVVFHVYLGIM